MSSHDEITSTLDWDDSDGEIGGGGEEEGGGGLGGLVLLPERCLLLGG